MSAITVNVVTTLNLPDCACCPDARGVQAASAIAASTIVARILACFDNLSFMSRQPLDSSGCGSGHGRDQPRHRHRGHGRSHMDSHAPDEPAPDKHLPCNIAWTLLWTTC